eukprot:2128084-Prymnesium_polylepis.1
METSGLHAVIDSPLAWASCPVHLLQAALQEPVAGGKPVRTSCRTSPAPLSTAERSRTTTPMTS